MKLNAILQNKCGKTIPIESVSWSQGGPKRTEIVQVPCEGSMLPVNVQETKWKCSACGNLICHG